MSAKKRPADCMNYGPCKSPKMISNSSDNNFNRMKVCVRVRPLSAKELERDTKTVVDAVDDSMLVFDPVVYNEVNDQYSYHGKVYKQIGKKPNKNLQFVFDRVFNENENNITVYQETTKVFVDSLLNGYNCSVFAYGSTGSGKTHTMLGSSNDPGVVFFTTMDLYGHLSEEEHKNLELSISYFEIYNEIIYDLLDPTSTQPLSVLEDGNKGMTVKNLSIHQPKDANHLIQMLEYGNKNRKQHPTDSNSESSRSHAIFQITLRRKDFSNCQEVSIQVSKMSLIDLAGSERASDAYKTYRSQSLHREGGNINKSLLSLGNCITALANNKRNNNYIPYRSSKLTLILRDSLGGNCQTLMIATVSPSAVRYDEVHNTLLYAERAKGVQLNIRKNNISVAVQPRDYKHLFEKMNIEKGKLLETIETLQQEVAKYKTEVSSVPREPITSSNDVIEILHSVKNTLDDLFAQRIDLRQKLLDCDHNIKLLDLRLMFRKYDNERMKMLEVEEADTNLNDDSKGPDLLHSIYSQKLHYANIRMSLVKEVEENENKIKEIEAELLDKTNNDIVVESYFLKNNSIAQAKDFIFSEKHCINIVEELFSKFESNQELISSSIHFNHKSFHILNGLGQISEDMDSKFNDIIRKIKGKKSVVWRDNIESQKVIKMKELVELFQLPVYMGNSSTPSDKRNLVAVRNITPIIVLENQALRTNINLVNSGTVTKHRNVAIVSPACNSNYNNGKENYRLFSNCYNKTPDIVVRPNSTPGTWSKRPMPNSTHRQNNHNNQYRQNYYGGSSNRKGAFSFNPKFKPKFRY